ncbi:unnamed protein product [Closterium sp. NIES-54]
MENLMYKDWKAENEAKIGMRFGEVKSSGLEHVELPLELSSGSTTTRQSSLVNGGDEAKDAEEEEEEVLQVSERAPTLPSRTTSAPQIRVTPQQGLHVPAVEEEGRGKRRIQAPNRLTYDALGKPAKSALAGAALMVGDDEESDYEECAFVFFTPVEMPGEPATLKEALESSDAEEWKKAMESELKSIEENGTWELVALPEGRKAITSKWLFKIKSDADGKIERYKSRLVAKGYQQKEKVEYKELFAPVVKPTTLRTLLAGAAIKGWGFDDGSGRVLRLKKAFYGLKQAPRQWYLKLRGVLEEIGFTPSTADHSLFMLGEGEQRSFMVVYVDDILIFSPSSDLVKEVMLKLQDKFKCKALGDVSFYLGLHIERDVEKRCMRMHQRKYLEALAATFGQRPEEESVGEEERRRFHSLVGSLMYAAVNTRPDVAFATGQLARVVQCPNEEQVAAGMRVAKYLGQTPTVGLQYSAAAQRRQKGVDGVEPGHLFLTAFSDASYASEPEDMTSVGGFICCVGGGPTAWESKKQVDQALSSVESEYMALFCAVREIVWQWRLLAELGEEQQGPTPLYCDSQGAIALAKNPVLHGLTKHMRVKWHWTRSMVAAGEVELHYVKTTGQPADMMTKRLVEQQHWKASAIWCVHLGLAAGSKGWLLWEPSNGVLFDSRDVKFVEGMMYGGWKKQPETKVSQQMERITMQLDLTPSVWKEGEEAAAEAGDGEKVQEAPGGGEDDEETSDSTKKDAGSEEGEQQQGEAKLTAGADVAEQQLGNEEALLILPHGYDPDEEDEPAYCFLAPALEEPASMEESLAGPDREKWLVSRDAEYQSLLENGTWDLVVLPEGKKAVQCKWVLRIKTDDKGQVTIVKSRLVAKGFMQKEKQDFNEIFAPTAKPPTLRVLLADAAVSGKCWCKGLINSGY